MRNKDLLSDCSFSTLLRRKKLVTLADYVKNMKEDQKYIYYAVGESTSKLDKLPQAESVRERGFEILYLTDDVDEFVMRTLMRFEDKEFRSVNDDDLGLETDDEKKAAEKAEKQNKDLLEFVKESLEG